MNRIRRIVHLSLLTLLWGLGPAILPASSSAQPAVLIRATDATASEPGVDTAVFTISRRGDLIRPLTVYYAAEGTAINGVDYEELAGSVTIPMGATSVRLEIKPLDDSLIEGTETVVIRLLMMPSPAYAVMEPAAATAYITDDDPPMVRPPVVTIKAVDGVATEIPQVPIGMGMPQRIDQATFRVLRTGPTNLPLTVYYRTGGTAINGDDYERLAGWVTIPAGASWEDIQVVPIDDTLVEGTETIEIQIEAPICIAIYPPPPECYTVGDPDTAAAFLLDNDPTTNLPPMVRITAPPNGALFREPAEVVIQAVTVDQDGYASKVEFFANEKKIGEQEIVFFRAPSPGQPIDFSFHWSNVVAGSYALTASTRDDRGATGMSSPVKIEVRGTNTPPTNLPPVVTIHAIDPYASEGIVVWTADAVVGANTWCSGMGVGSDIVWRTDPAVPSWIRVCPFGTNTAVFAVRRSGNTNTDLRVFYAVSGTATPGLDYVELPGAVTIPAGRRAATITIMPLDDSIPEKIETVVLNLQLPPLDPAGAEAQPAYLIGGRGRAAAFIVDNDQPRPPIRPLPGGLFHVVRPEATNGCFRIEVSLDLKEWTAVCTNEVKDRAVHFVDPDAGGYAQRFYRMVPVPCETSE